MWARGAALDFELAGAALFTCYVKGAGFSCPYNRHNYNRPTLVIFTWQEPTYRAKALHSPPRAELLHTSVAEFGGTEILSFINTHSVGVEVNSGIVGLCLASDLHNLKRLGIGLRPGIGSLRGWRHGIILFGANQEDVVCLRIE